MLLYNNYYYIHKQEQDTMKKKPSENKSKLTESKLTAEIQ